METTDSEESLMLARYIVIAIVALIGLAFFWRELPAVIRYLKIVRM